VYSALIRSYCLILELSKKGLFSIDSLQLPVLFSRNKLTSACWQYRNTCSKLDAKLIANFCVIFIYLFTFFWHFNSPSKTVINAELVMCFGSSAHLSVTFAPVFIFEKFSRRANALFTSSFNVSCIVSSRHCNSRVPVRRLFVKYTTYWLLFNETWNSGEAGQLGFAGTAQSLRVHLTHLVANSGHVCSARALWHLALWDLRRIVCHRCW